MNIKYKKRFVFIFAVVAALVFFVSPPFLTIRDVHTLWNNVFDGGRDSNHNHEKYNVLNPLVLKQYDGNVFTYINHIDHMQCIVLVSSFMFYVLCEE
ncbi:Amidohydrolase [Edwardsiella anguillarum]|uniref:hypothetical protein n=1 Tax=Edwardsiella TaxID=635 RepID=UPI00045CA4DB|nr:hypothetical protein [Edwardsiella anguillarum]BET86681.1 Amidohydrolase [Edwardsiella anguillarum]BET90107.1 Amidohydrolase [Edwardsiella anguillarum]GAJ66674.1 amidohydrolase [Edwardsiella piscicida]